MTQLYQLSHILLTYMDKNHAEAFIIKIDRDKTIQILDTRKKTQIFPSQL